MAGSTGQFEVARSTTIAAPAARVHALLRDFHAWEAWSPWEGIDPDLQRTYTGSDAGVGAKYAWTGNRKVGSGSMEITEEVPDQRLVIALEFLKPFKASNTAIFELAPADGGTTVTWRMVGPRTFMTKVMGIFTSMDKMVGPDFEKGLAQLSTAATS